MSDTPEGKVRLKVIEQVEQVREVEVEAPWYRKHDVSGDNYSAVSYTKIYEDPEAPGQLRFVKLNRSHYYRISGVSWEVEAGPYKPDNSGKDYVLGLGQYSFTAEGWEMRRREMEAWLREVGALEKKARRQQAARPRRVTDLVTILERQIAFSTATFGHGYRWDGLIEHIEEELREIENDPDDLSEWIDVVILGLDGAWRCGHTPEQVARALLEKIKKNETRDWPPIEEQVPGRKVKHITPEEAD